MSARRHKARGARASQRGQAMAEFAVAVGVLGLLLVCLPALQRYHQLQFAAIGAARLDAWQASWAPATSTARDAGGVALADGATLARRWLPEGIAAAGVGAEASGQPMVAQVQSSLARGAAPGAAGSASQALLLPMRPLQLFGSGFDLGAGGWVEARTVVDVASPASLPEPFNGLSLQFDERAALLGDGWGAAGPAQVARRVGGLVPTSVFNTLPGVVTVGSTLLSLIEPQFRHFCPGRVDPEVVPADRLGAGRADAPPTPWSPPC